MSPNPTVQLTAMLSVHGIHGAVRPRSSRLTWTIRPAAAARTAAQRGRIQAYGREAAHPSEPAGRRSQATAPHGAGEL